MVDRRHIWTVPITERKKQPLGWEPRVTLHGAFGTGQSAEVDPAGWDPLRAPTPPQTPWRLPSSPGWESPPLVNINAPSLYQDPIDYPKISQPPPYTPPPPEEQPTIRILSEPDDYGPSAVDQDEEPTRPRDIVLGGDDDDAAQPIALGGTARGAAVSPAINVSNPQTILGMVAPAITPGDDRDAVLRAWAPTLYGIEQGGGPLARNLAAIILAESGAGRDPKGLAMADNNWFSISAVGDRPFQNGVGAGGRFAHYDSPLHSVADFVDLISTSPRYAQAWALRNAPVEQFIGALKDAGYIAPEEGFPVETWLRNTAAGGGIFDQVVGPSPMVTNRTTTEQPGMANNTYDVAFGFNQPYGGAQFNPNIPNHRGIDLTIRGAPNGGRGQPVGAFQGGVVAAVTEDLNGGNGVIIQTPDGLYHRYFHFDDVNVQQGQRIAPGQRIGILGATGSEDFPHVHFEVSKNIQGDPMDQLIDPRPYMTPGEQLGQGQSSLHNRTNGRTISGGVETAQTPEARMQGLLGRTDAGEGMLLPDTQQVHMRGMQIPLDIAYFDAKGKVIAVHTLQPGQTGPVVPGATKVVELPAGRAQQTNLRPGDEVGMGQGTRDRWWEDQQEEEQPEPIVIPVYTPEGEPAEPIVIPVERASDRGWAGQISDTVQGAARGAGEWAQGATQGLSGVASAAATEAQRRLAQGPSASAEEYYHTTPGGKIIDLEQRATQAESAGDQEEADRLRRESDAELAQIPIAMHLGGKPFDPLNPAENVPNILRAQQRDPLMGRLARLGEEAPPENPMIYGPQGEVLSPTETPPVESPPAEASLPAGPRLTAAQRVAKGFADAPAQQKVEGLIESVADDKAFRIGELDSAGADPNSQEYIGAVGIEERTSGIRRRKNETARDYAIRVTGREPFNEDEVDLARESLAAREAAPGGGAPPPVEPPPPTTPPEPPTPPEPEPNRPGFGWRTGDTPEGQAILNQAAEAEREYPGGVTHEETLRRATALAIDNPQAVDQFADALLQPGGTTLYSDMATALRTRAIGASENIAQRMRAQGASENLAQIERDAARVQQLQAEGRPVTDIPLEDRMAMAERLLQGAKDSAMIQAEGRTGAKAIAAGRRVAEAMGRGLNSFQIRIQAQKAQRLAERAEQQAKAAREAGPIIDRARKGNVPLPEEDLQKLSRHADEIEAGGDPDEAAIVAERLTPSRTRAEGAAQAPGGKPAAAEKTLAQELGDVERAHADAHGASLEELALLEKQRNRVLDKIEAEAQRRADEMEVKAQRELTPEEIERAVSEALGAPTVAKMNREALEAAGKLPPPTTVQEIVKQIRDGERVAIKDQAQIARHWALTAREFPDELGYRAAFDNALMELGTHGAAGQRMAGDLRANFRSKLGEDYDKFMSTVRRRTTQELDKRATRREARMQKLDLEGVRDQAREIIDDIVNAPTNRERDLHTQDLTTLLDDAEIAHGEAGHRLSAQLQAEAVRLMNERRASTMGSVEARNVQSTVSDIKTAEREKARALADQIRAFVKMSRENPHALGTGLGSFNETQLSRLYEDLMLVGKEGQERASRLRESIYKAGAYRLLGKEGDEDRLELLVSMLGQTHTSEDMAKLIRVLRQPRLLDYLYEWQYFNMLSNPVTQVNNALQNTAQVGGRLAFNSLEVGGDIIFNRGNRQTTWAEVGAARRGARAGWGPGAAEAREIMRTGQSPNASQRALELSNLNAVNREYFTEKFGKPGAIMHTVSSRPLESMDALLGSVAYASAVEQYTTRKAAMLLRRGGDHNVTAGMNLADAAQKVKANIWDYPDVVEQAGKVRNYTLLKGVDYKNNVERWLTHGASFRNPGPNASGAQKIGAFIANQILPFYGVPLNWAKQGIDRTFGPVYNLPLAFKGAPEMRPERFKRAVVGMAAVGTASILAMGDNLTGEGPEDPDENKQWRADHEPNSWRIPGGPWWSYQGTPWGMPFAVVAQTKENVDRAAKLAGGRAKELPEVALDAAFGGVKGAFKGFLGQSFMQSVAQTYENLGGKSGLNPAAIITGTTSRFIAPGALRFFAQVGDDMERDATHGEDFGQQMLQRTMANYPGGRQFLPPRQRVLGEPEPNQAGGWPIGTAIPKGFLGVLPLPFRPRSGSDPNNPIIDTYSQRGITIGGPPKSLTLGGQRVNITSDEQRVYRDLQGRVIRQQLGGVNPSTVDGKRLKEVLDTARTLATDAVMANLSPDELKKRMLATLPPNKGSKEGREQAIGLLVDLNDKSKHPEFVMPDGQTPIGNPSAWAEMRALLEVESHKPDPKEPWYQPLSDAQKRAAVTKLVSAWADPRYDQYERYVVGQLGNGMTEDEWDAFQAGGAKKYDIPGSTPREWREMDQVIKLYRTLPASAAGKAQLRPKAQLYLRLANPAWRGPLAYDEIAGRKETGELDALDAAYKQGIQQP